MLVSFSLLSCISLLHNSVTEEKRHAWSDKDLFNQIGSSSKALSENVFHLELSASCQNLSNNSQSQGPNKLATNRKGEHLAEKS